MLADVNFGGTIKAPIPKFAPIALPNVNKHDSVKLSL